MTKHKIKHVLIDTGIGAAIVLGILALFMSRR